ncbi:hypothetical protein CCAX7_003190 [Capsulimonas corticalis]|uniref:Uncharacterized protein n=1 Tax=Capsulimonas corticalis TaxID=2219043 RepID=A0A402CS69_9BACT|nr:carboxypeptidase regulatory-like domain-containing protein [Capsulimonas corticalis]BDI28268.1 hypothetical protein CCAX7_003190 [Capsulimonas corticalis]
MNARFRHLRIATLCSIFLALILTGILAALSPQASIAQRGNTANALALNGMLNASSLGGSAVQTPLRYPYVQDPIHAAFSQSKASANAASAPVTISEAVQTFDVFAPSPDFQPLAGPLTPTNKTPVWTSDEQFIVFASNRPGVNGADGHFHLWIIDADGGAPAQLTNSAGDEFYPVLSPSNNQIAFTSDAQTPGTQNLFYAPFSKNPASPINVASLNSPTVRTIHDLATGFSNVGRPAWSPKEERLAFSALTNVGPDAGHSHVYYLYVKSAGYLENGGNPNPPGKLTFGNEEDKDVAWSPDGAYLVFTSNATGFGNTGTPFDPNTGATPVAAMGVNADTSTRLFALNADTGTLPTTLVSLNGVLTPGPNDGGAAWADVTSVNRGYVAFHRAVPNTGGGGGIHFQIYFWLAENANGTLNPFTDNDATAQALNTSNTQNSNDLYPAWPRLLKRTALTYQSNRSVTYQDPANNNAPVETAITLVPGGGVGGVGVDYVGILESAIQYINPPKLLRFNAGEIVHINAGDNYIAPTAGDPSGSAKRLISPSTHATFTVRLSDRESGLDDNNVYLQFKDPDSKYQDTRLGGVGMEHKVFTHGNLGNVNNPGLVQSLANFGFDPFTTIGGAIGYTGAAGVAFDGNNILGVGHTDLTLNNGGANVAGPTRLPGYNPAQFTAWGQEFECQYLNANYYAGNANQADPTPLQYGTPFYLAGFDDQQPNSAPTARPEWLKLTRLPANKQDSNGGVLYSTTTGWKVPASPSDYYIDVIAYDKAKNWRIFDNVWGFNSHPFAGSAGILVVSDYTLGQKFVTSAQVQSGASNLYPTFYGTESYYTDIDTDLLPNSAQVAIALKGYPKVTEAAIPPSATATPSNLQAYTSFEDGDSTADVVLRWGAPTPTPTSYLIFRTTVNGNTSLLTQQLAGTATRFVDRSLNGGDPKSGTDYIYFVSPQGNGGGTAQLAFKMPDITDLKSNGVVDIPLGGPRANLSQFDNPLADQPRTFPAAKNALGVSSFGATPPGNGPNGSPAYDNTLFYQANSAAIDSQKYDIWRILSRGPVSDAVLTSYASNPTFQPAVNDNGLNEPGANFPDARKCVLWVAPYANQLVTGPGTIQDPATQTQLTNFVAAGGRLFVSGAHIGSAITTNGAASNTPTDFIGSVLGAKYTGQTTIDLVLPFLNPAGATGNRLTFDPYFNQNTNIGAYTFDFIYTTDDNRPYQYSPPSAHPMIIANNDGQAFDAGVRANWRNDGSLDQFGQFVEQYGLRIFSGDVDTVQALPGMHNDITYSGNAGLIYHEDTAGNGGRVIYAPFGLEGIGMEYYRVTKGQDFYLPYNMRPNLVHNVVTYLRSGTVNGQVTDSRNGGTGVGDAIVYLLPNGPTAIPGMPTGRTVYSGKTDPKGNYSIDGVETGAYIAVAYKSGYSRGTSSLAYGVEALQTTPITVSIAKLDNGSITGHVKYQDGAPANNATVSFTAPDGTLVTGSTDTTGLYTISAPSAADPGLTYTNGIATKTGATTNPPVSVTVASGKSVTQDFVLPPVPSFFTGTVTDATTHQPLQGVTVAFTVSGGTTVAGTTTTAADGTYTSPNLPSGDYDITATLAPDYLIGTALAVHAQEGETTTQDFALTKASPGSLSGVVKYADGRTVAGAKVVFTPTPSGTALTTTTDSNGHYSIASVPSGTDPGKSYSAQSSKGHSSSPVLTTIVPSGQAVVQNFTMPIPPGNFFGKISEYGTTNPLVGATVTFTPASGPSVQVLTDVNGGYNSGNLVAGTYTITASDAPDYEPTAITGIVLAEDATVGKNIGLKKVVGAHISGVVRSPSGVPVPAATITFVAPGKAPLTTTTDLTGAYVITNLPTVSDPGLQYTGTATKGAATSASATVTVTSGAVLKQNFTLEPPQGTFTGTVTDAATNKPLFGATVTFTPLQGADRTPATATTAVDGTYTSPALNFGNYQVVATLAPKYLPQTVSPVYLADSVTTTQNLKLTKAPNGVIGGLVTFANAPSGTGPVGGATVTITPSDGSTPITVNTSASVTTGANGSVNYQASVSPGGYTVTVSKAGYVSSSSVTVTLASSGFQRANLTFDPIATIPAGVRMISAPYDYSNVSLDALLGVGQPAGSVRIAIWQPLLLNYVLNPTAPADALHIGYGYWVKLAANTNIYNTGVAPTAASVSVPLHKYWNQIGVPSTTSINVSDLTFTASDGSSLTFAQASAPDRNIVDKTLYSYDTASNAYVPVTAGGTLTPWQGYWIKVYKDTTVTIPTNATAVTGAFTRRH